MYTGKPCKKKGKVVFFLQPTGQPTGSATENKSQAKFPVRVPVPLATDTKINSTSKDQPVSKDGPSPILEKGAIIAGIFSSDAPKIKLSKIRVLRQKSIFCRALCSTQQSSSSSPEIQEVICQAGPGYHRSDSKEKGKTFLFHRITQIPNEL